MRIIWLFLLAAVFATPTSGETIFQPDIFGLAHIADKATKPLYTVKDSGIQMDFRASPDNMQELIALRVTSSFGTVGPILFSSAFSPFTPQYIIKLNLLIVMGGHTLIIIDCRANTYQIIPMRAVLLLMVGEKLYLESPDQWGQGYDLTSHTRIDSYLSKDRPYEPKRAFVAKEIETGGRVVERKDVWKWLSPQPKP
jgi:hypothetical protein